MMSLLQIGNMAGTEILILVLVMGTGMLALYLILKHEKNSVIPIWILVVFVIPFFGAASYLVKYFLFDKRRSL